MFVTWYGIVLPYAEYIFGRKKKNNLVHHFIQAFRSISSVVGIGYGLSLLKTKRMTTNEFFFEIVNFQHVSFFFDNYLYAVCLIGSHRKGIKITLIGNGICFS